MSEKTLTDNKVIEKIHQIPIADLHLNPDNIRNQKKDYDPNSESMKSLLADIRIHGIVTPLVALKDGMVLCGNRRLTAANILGLRTVPCIVRELASEEEKVFFQMSENMVRQFPASFDRGKAYRALMSKFGLTKDDIIARTGDSDVSSCIREYDNFLKARKEAKPQRTDKAMERLRKRKDFSAISKIIFKRDGISPQDKISLVEAMHAPIFGKKGVSSIAAEAVAQQLQNVPLINGKQQIHSVPDIVNMLTAASLLDEHVVLIYEDDWKKLKAVHTKTQSVPTVRHLVAELLKRAIKANLLKEVTQ